MRIVQISDTHLSHFGGMTNDNFGLLVEFVNDVIDPDYVVNTGDISILSPDIAEDRELAHKLHEGFRAPLLVVPGNHDVGEPGPAPWMGISVTSERVEHFCDTFGAGRFCVPVDDDWALLGLNSEILSSGLKEEDEQWEWLAETAESITGRNVLLFLHKPLWSPAPEFTEHAIAVTESDRDRVLESLSGTRLRAVASGHLHRFTTAWQGDVLTVGAPSSAFIVRSGHLQLGLNQLGVVEWRIDGDAIEAFFRSVPTLTEDEPYGVPAFAETMAIINATLA